MGREHSQGMNGRSKSRLNSAQAAGAFPCMTKIVYLNSQYCTQAHELPMGNK